jgi:hypothetical protein
MKQDGFVNINIQKSKGGKLYACIDDWEPTQQANNQQPQQSYQQPNQPQQQQNTQSYQQPQPTNQAPQQQQGYQAQQPPQMRNYSEQGMMPDKRNEQPAPFDEATDVPF